MEKNRLYSKQVERITKNVDIIIQAAAATWSKDIVNNPQKHVTDNAIMNSNIMKSAYENSKTCNFFSCTVMYPSSK